MPALIIRDIKISSQGYVHVILEGTIGADQHTWLHVVNLGPLDDWIDQPLEKILQTVREKIHGRNGLIPKEWEEAKGTGV